MSYVVPGEAIAVEEEALPQQGVYVDQKGFLRSYVVGIAQLDRYKKVAQVKPVVKREFSLKPGCVAEGVVTGVGEDYALVKLYSNSKGERINAIGILHISQISSEYISDILDYIRPSDIVRAKVLNSSPPYLLSTKDPSTGVILAYCGSCGKELYLTTGGVLVCINCGRREKRKTAVGYLLVSR
ncbi:MAG: exosome complex RNA-binding protein Csl4 [Desulfurococcaceae archaeon]